MLARDCIRILDFDGSVADQLPFLKGIASDSVDLRPIGASARLWGNDDCVDLIRKRLDPAKRNWITFLGSGDYHYVSALLLEQFQEPFSLVVFDHHPDWDCLPPRRGCGAWVSRALENPLVSQVLLVGNASQDLEFPSIVTGNLRSVRENRTIMLPWTAPQRQVWPWNRIPWHELSPDPVAVFAKAVAELPTRQVYVSIDKDCLSSAHALTNWEEGRLSLDLLLGFLRELGRGRDIVGLDITGEFSPARPQGLWKTFCSSIDHPSGYSAKGMDPELIARVNGLTNRSILNLLMA